MNIPETIVQDILDELTSSLKDIYVKYVQKTNGIQFSVHIRTLLNQFLDLLKELSTIENSTIDPVVNKRWKTKKRWLETELKTASQFFKEIDVVAKSLYEQFEHQPERFRAVYDCDSYEELRNMKLQELSDWAKNNDIPVCAFPYLKGKQAFQIQKAFKNDVEYVILNIIRDKCPNGMQSAIVALPNSMSNIPIDFTNRVKIGHNLIVENGREQFYVNKYYIDDQTFLENFMNVEILKTGVVSNVLKTLNARDISIFLYVMSVRDENFYITREVVVDIGGIVRNVFSSDAQKNYMSVKESLYRMQHLNSGAIDSSLRGFTVKIFDSVDIYKANDGKEMARVMISTNIVNEYIKNQTINMYKDIIDKFILGSSKVAIFPLQRERIRCSTNSVEGEPLLFQTNINFFKGILYLSNKRKKENLKLIEKLLQEIIDNKITVKSFVRKGDTFIIEFYPITNHERRDLMNQRDSILLEDPYEQITLDIG